MKGLKGFITIIFIIALIAKVIVCCESGGQQSNEISDSTLVKKISINVWIIQKNLLTLYCNNKNKHYEIYRNNFNTGICNMRSWLGV